MNFSEINIILDKITEELFRLSDLLAVKLWNATEMFLMALGLFAFFFIAFPLIVLHNWVFKSFYQDEEN